MLLRDYLKHCADDFVTIRDNGEYVDIYPINGVPKEYIDRDILWFRSSDENVSLVTLR